MREQMKQQIRKAIVTLSKAETILENRAKMKDEAAVCQLLSFHVLEPAGRDD